VIVPVQVLLVLIQQNCIETHLQPAEVLVTGLRPAVYLYEALLNSALQILRCALVGST
jgi:DNA-directed RNA polymerase III subunit RPC3